MIIAKCPLRISLAGGSTDLQDFIDTNGFGSVISFPASVYAYISIHNNNRQKYIINYTKREEVEKVEEIKNDIAREVLKYFDCPPVTVTFNTDIQTVGSGLATSSAYLIAAIAAISTFKNISLSNFEICKLALKLERIFNPLTGYQDPYGCGIGSLKRMVFKKGKDPEITFLNQQLFNQYNMFLIYTGIVRQSTNVLEQVIKTDRTQLLTFVSELENAIIKNNDKNFLKCINDSWNEKKKTTPYILLNENVKKIDDDLKNNKSILAHRLCGAGNGGYFFVITEKKYLIESSIYVSINQKGIEVFKI
jgi:D-glycero-alpha-D-manno-heptose-7-phosphate kinase